MSAGNGHSKTLPFNCNDQSTFTWRQRADSCAVLMKSLMPESDDGFSLADIGCGDQKLRTAVEAHGIRCRYHAYDLFPQRDEIQQLDVEKETLPQPYDLAVMLGVIEYLEHAEQALRRLAERVSYLIVSHVVRQGGHYTRTQLEKLNWRNHLSEPEFEAALRNNGFLIISRSMAPDRRTMLFACRSQLMTLKDAGPSS